ncbi:hypothetical protein PV332_10525 [Streptomyces scabiei]|uniref:hypothetical protein n=1 Tax=Streptomyces scabiei TaxID=1930 RepID=UPI0029B6D8E1|nr:hypothetical protein [Streptomyces scabiei]MDX2575915.1 hypothetical protein [Streptomyces scabiei]MDX2885612.1 hypothetical protein [Streptomyces scabiei]MDX2993435.1 hypothetical protein [Streptomyces scabiei]MDX3028451.1 hypothetical protein [Streptomyces scabiei]MDX3047215.1 hypothetical protein [Streptomyces scabiei]
MDTPGLRELTHWIEKTADPVKTDGYAERLYERIGREAVDVEHVKQRAEATNAALVDEYRGEVYACRAVLRALQSFAKQRDDDTAKRVYATIARFNLGEMFRPGGGADRYLIPVELTEEEPTA